MYYIPSDVIEKFLTIGTKNVSFEDSNLVETLAFLVGYKKGTDYYATHIIFPEQHGEAFKVEDKGINGEDSFFWLSNKSNIFNENSKPIPIAWVHSHVRGIKCGFSSIDTHTQFAFNRYFEEMIGLVVEIDSEKKYACHDYYSLTQMGKSIIGKCSKDKNISSLLHDECALQELFKTVKCYVEELSDKNIQVINFFAPLIEQERKKQCESKCKECKREYKSLLLHISKNSVCKVSYSMSEILKLKEQRQELLKIQRKKYRTINADIIREKKRRDFQLNKEVISKQQKIYRSENEASRKAKRETQQKFNRSLTIQKQHLHDSKHSEAKKRKQSEYNMKNADWIRRKQSKYDKQHAEEIREKQSQYDKEHALEVRKKQSRYNKQHAEEIREKQSQYDNEHALEVRKKQSRYNKEHAEDIREKQQKSRLGKKSEMTTSDRILAFKRQIVDGPNFICHSCHRSLFKKSVKVLPEKEILKLKEKLDEKMTKRLLLEKTCTEVKFCHNCLKTIRDKRIPSLHHSNNLELDEVPEELAILTDMEQQLIAVSLIFMKIKKLPTSRMQAVIDRIISVPLNASDVNKTVSKLPRHPDEAHIIAVKFKRKLELKGAHLEEYISPSNVLAALKVLKELGNPNYADIFVDEEFHEPKTIHGDDEAKSVNNAELENSKQEDNDIDSEILNEAEDNNQNENDEDEQDGKVLNEVNKFQSNQHSKTCLMPQDMNSEINNTSKDNDSLEIAPGEGKIPTNFLREPNVDVKAFPKHHPTGRNGKDAKREQKITDQMYFNQRLLNKDQRFAMDPFYLFFASSYIERLALEKQIDIAGQKGVSRRNESGEQVVSLNDIYDVFKKVKGTPRYWQSARTELVAKVKQLGPFHLYFTFSCGEMRWIEAYLSIFKRKKLDIVYLTTPWDGSAESILVEGLPLWEFVNSLAMTKHELFKDYTFLITQIFDERVKSFISNILMGGGKDKVPVSHYSYRVEFQARGMPHIHGVAWIEKNWLRNFGIDGYLTDYPEQAVSLANQVLSCELPAEDKEICDIVKEVQKHHHTKSCRKYNGLCRYGFPKLPSPKILLALPLSDNVGVDQKKKIIEEASDILTRAKDFLESDEFDENLSMTEFYAKIDTNEAEYVEALSISEKGKILILKRDLKEVFVNNYNQEMISAWNANMDIQLALDPYAIITYIVSYVSKDESGMTTFLKDALKASANETMAEKIKALKMAYLTHRQVGWSEAVYRILPGMKLRDSNIATIFVATGFPENRSVFYKKVPEDSNIAVIEDKMVTYSDDENEEFEDSEESTDLVRIEGKTGNYKKAVAPHDRYSVRPKRLEEMCFAQFATSYTPTSKIPKRIDLDHDGNSNEVSHQKIFNKETPLPLYISLLGSSLMRLRSFPSVLSIHSSKKKEGHEQYYSELLLYCHWRNEVEDFHRWFPTECESKYKERIQELKENKDCIYPGEDLLELLESEDFDNIRPVHVFDMIDSQRQQENEDDKDIGCEDDSNYASFAMTDHLAKEVNYEEFKYKKISLPSKEDLDFLTLRLVPEQMNILKRVVQYCKDVVKSSLSATFKPEPIRLIVHGGAGVGKSAIIKAITLHAENILRSKGDHPNHPRVLVCAPTGKAASLISGVTLHSAFDFKFGNEHLPLSDKSLAKFRENFKGLKLLIIDEMSLLGSDMLYKIHMRLNEIFQKKIPSKFGEISIVLVGDLLQIAPVKANYIFDNPRNQHFLPFHEVEPLWKSFEPMILKYNHRQGNGSFWVESLNRFREGIVTEEDKEILSKRMTNEEHLDTEAIHIFYTNVEVAEHNEKMLNLLDSPLISIKAKKSASGQRKYNPPITADGRIENTQFFDNLKIKIGARCSLTWNLSTVDDLVNGSTGTIVGVEISKLSKDKRVEAIIVQFDDPNAGMTQRLKYERISRKYKDVNGTPILRYEHDYNIRSRKGYAQAATAKVEQFPLRIYYASTAHKMQGQTVIAGTKVIIHWNKRMAQEKGMAYVMLGRTQRIEDIFIKGEVDFGGISSSILAKLEAKRLDDVFEKQAKQDEDFFILSYLNIRSLNAHKMDVENDDSLMSSDVIAFGETWLAPCEDVDIKGFHGTFASIGRGKGLSTHTKDEEMSSHVLLATENGSLIKTTLRKFQVIFAYLSNSCNQIEICRVLEKCLDVTIPTIIMGDMNVDAKKDCLLKSFLEERAFSQMIKKPTHEKGFIIDHIYVNENFNDEDLRIMQQAVYYSDHDIISIGVKQL